MPKHKRAVDRAQSHTSTFADGTRSQKSCPALTETLQVSLNYNVDAKRAGASVGKESDAGRRIAFGDGYHYDPSNRFTLLVPRVAVVRRDSCVPSNDGSYTQCAMSRIRTAVDFPDT